jgi:hypothetical protein
MKVTGPQGDKGDQGDQGPQGIQGVGGPVGPPGNLWHWFPIDPPTPGIGVPGDMVLVLNHATPDMPGNGNVYRVMIGGGYSLDGNLRGPIGPKGDPGDVSWADLIPIVNRIDALQARVDRLESFQLATLPNDMRLVDGADTIVTTVVVPAGGDSQGSAHLTFELNEAGVEPPGPGASMPKLVTAWIEPIGAVVLTGPASGQVTLHQALPYATLSIGPVRAVATGAGNVVLYVRSTDLGGGAPRGNTVLKAATSVVGTATAKPLATGLIAR